MTEQKISSFRPVVYIVSGGAGTSASQLVNTVLVQFPENEVDVVTMGNVRYPEQLVEVTESVRQSGGIILHTLIESKLRQDMIRLAGERGVQAVDLMGPLVEFISGALGIAPLEKPGLYRQLHKDYFSRVAAIEYTMAHDDGKDPDGWKAAEIILAGVSRSGKTPLSLYLSVLGWKVANVPLVPEIPTSRHLFEVDPHRVVGLTIDPGQLLLHRQQRQKNLGVTGPSAYIDPEKVLAEVQEVERIFRKSGFSIVDVTDKPIESSADEVIRLITRKQPAGV